MSDIQRAEGNQGNDGFSDEWDRLARKDDGLEQSPQESDDRHESDRTDEGQAGQEETPPNVEAATPPAPSENTDDIWANAPEALRQAFMAERGQREKAENVIRSNNGRLSKAEREAAELRTRLAAPQEQAPPATKPEPSDKLKAVAQEYGEVAGPLVEELVELRSIVSRLENSNASVVEQARARDQLRLAEAAAGEEQKLAETHPDWLEVVNAAEFATWVQSGPRFIRDGVARNGDGIVDGEEAASILSLFKQSQGQPAPDPLRTKRERQLEGARAVPVRTPGATPQGTPDDFGAAWDQLEAEDERRSQRRTATR